MGIDLSPSVEDLNIRSYNFYRSFHARLLLAGSDL